MGIPPYGLRGFQIQDEPQSPAKQKKPPGHKSEQGAASLYNKKLFGNLAIMTCTVLDPRLCGPSFRRVCLFISIYQRVYDRIMVV